MKIPSKIDKALTKRRVLAEKLLLVCTQIDSWLEAKGLLKKCENYDVLTGCEIYCNPASSEDRIRAIIEREK